MTLSSLKEFKHAFQLFDSNNDGKISKLDLKHVMQSLNQKLDIEQLNKMAKFFLVYIYLISSILFGYSIDE